MGLSMIFPVRDRVGLLEMPLKGILGSVPYAIEHEDIVVDNGAKPCLIPVTEKYGC